MDRHCRHADLLPRISRHHGLNPTIEIVLRTHSDEEAELLETEKVGKVFMAEHMLAISMTSHILGRMGIEDTGNPP